MREFKFRSYGKCGMLFATISSNEYIENMKHVFINGNEHIPKNLMQYTGLKDKNGKEIYEGDICNINYPYISPFVVSMGLGEDPRHALGENFYQLITYAGTELDSLEVIGNIYENPELLNGQNTKKTSM